MKTEIGSPLKWLYCVTLVAGIFPSGLYGASGWVGLATGGGMFSGELVAIAIFLAAFICRIVVVVRNPHRLDAYVTSTPARVLRNLGIFLMVLGLIGSFGIFFIGPLTMGIFGKAGDGGIAFFVVGLVVSLISTAGLSGLLAFEASRLLGFEVRLDDEGHSATNNQIQIARSAAR